MATEFSSLFAQLYHTLSFPIKKPKVRLERSILIISIDVDVGSRTLGIINKGKNDANVNKFISEYHVGEMEEMAIPLFVETFNHLEIPVTFAIRGQLTEVGSEFLETLVKCHMKHDIGAHGYYHRHFTNLSHNEAERELNLISAGMRKFGVRPRSFAFPAGKVAHLSLLEEHGYKCYRGYGDFLHDRMDIEKCGKLYNVHPSLYINQNTKLALLKNMLKISIARKMPFHIWFHLWSLGKSEESVKRKINTMFIPLLKYAKQKENSGALSFETMLSATEKVEMISAGTHRCMLDDHFPFRSYR